MMTSQTRQDANKNGAVGILKGKHQAHGTTTDPSRRVHFGTNEKSYGDHNELVVWEDLLPWQQDNEYILSGHRRATFSYLRSLKSTFRIHNETVNIWSHILGTVAFILALSILYLFSSCRRDIDKNCSMADAVAVFTYFVSVIACFVFSFIYHIFLDQSEHIRKLTCRFDYLGIVIPLWGTTVSSTHFGFRCEQYLQDFYGPCATVAGLLCAIATLHPAFSGRTGRNVRTGIYLLLGLSSFLPIVHGVWLHGLEEHNRRIGLVYYVGLGLCHGTGAILYAARVPERWYPRRFDIVGSSHQLMHVLVVCGAVCYGIGILRANKYWSDVNCGAVR